MGGGDGSQDLVKRALYESHLENSLAMMANPSRLSTFSSSSTPIGLRSAGQYSTQVSTTTLLNALHTIYTSAQPYRLDASTSLVVNTWLTAANPNIEGHQGGTVDHDLARQAWEHARRRAEDGCVVLAYVYRNAA